MQKRIFKTMTALICCTLLFFISIAGSIVYSYYKKSVTHEIKAIASIAMTDNHTPQEISVMVNNAMDLDIRVTFIKSDGTVAFDSRMDAKYMENHGSRDEFISAMKNGSAEAVRQSQTLGYSTYYYACRYNDGVIRFSAQKNNLMGFFISLIPVLSAVAILIIFTTTLISKKLSEKLINPINDLVSQLDVTTDDNIIIETPYIELQPIIKNAETLMKKIRKNITRLNKEREKISVITANMNEGLIMLDSDMNVLSVNKSALSILHSSFNSNAKENVRKLTDNSELLNLFAIAYESDSASDILLIDGRYYNTFINKAKSESGEYDFGIIAFLVDVTESVQNEHIRRDFSANVSHELKTPLTTIKGFGELLSNGIYLQPDDVKKYGSMIYRESERLLLLINDIIRISEIEDGINLLDERINLLQIAVESKEILQHKADSENIDIHVSGEDTFITGNRNYISEILLNLMDNSIKYNHSGGDVWVSISTENEMAKIVVKDNGIGISPEHQQRVFERFYRVDKSRSKRIGGTGLGLSIVKHMVACHNGEIYLESKVGSGTEITILFKKAD